MSKTITLCNTSSEYFAVTKTTTDDVEKSVEIVYPCDILRPTLKLKGGNISYNYIKSLFGRNYWITGQTLDNGVNYVSCVVDAWASWKSDIYGTSQFVLRSEKQGNPFINDTSFPCTSQPVSQVFKGDLLTENVTYVIGVI